MQLNLTINFKISFHFRKSKNRTNLAITQLTHGDYFFAIILYST